MKTTFTEEKGKMIVRALRIGTPLKHAAIAIGSSEDTVNRWIRRGLDGEEPYVEFAKEAYAAKGSCVINYHAAAAKLVQEGDSAMVRFMLQKKCKEEYGESVTVEVRDGVEKTVRECVAMVSQSAKFQFAVALALVTGTEVDEQTIRAFEELKKADSWIGHAALESGDGRHS